MDFTTTAEQDALTRRIVRFGQDELSGRFSGSAPDAFDAARWKSLAEFGVLGWPVPAEFGGSGLDPLTCVLALEALGYGCRDNGLVFAVNNHLWACTSYLLAHGDAGQQARWLPGLRDGTVVGAHAMTEPEAGSDMLAMTTTARLDGDRYLLNGVKTFISNAPVAGLFVLFARTDPDAPPQRRLSAFLVDGRAPGVSVRPLAKSGMHGCPMGEITLTDVPVPVHDRLGAAGTGYQIFTSSAESERGHLLASQVGTLRRLVETAAGYAARRRQFGRPVSDFQAVSHRIADLRLTLETARLLLYKFGWLRRQGRLALLEASMLKLHLGESLPAAAIAVQQIHGARGYVTEYDVEREVRDALATPVYAGTSDIQRSIIASLTGAACVV